MKGMISTECTPEAFEDLIDNPEWLFEQKMDGTRCIIEIDHNEMAAYQRNGNPLKHTAALQHLDLIFDGLMNLAPGTVVDGEIMIQTGEYLVFDLPVHPLLSPTAPYVHRRLMLTVQPFRGPVDYVRQAVGHGAKADLLREVEEAGAEGLVAKHLHSPYESGVRVKHVLKRKFVQTADVIVTEVNRPDPKHGSFTLAVNDPETGKVVGVGACSAIGKPLVKVGEVIEVNFLNWTGTRLYQPRMMKIREDKLPQECLTDQFRPYSRESVLKPGETVTISDDR